ncbi:MAG TPA: hypothetical protein VLD83_06150 [Candidatus Binatia bacterium]|nr:hypothetical protein [Candidatus Binatia bacterium]
MKAAITEITRNYLFRVFLALSTVASVGSSVWAYYGIENQGCSVNCERIALAEISRYSQITPPAIRPVNFAPAEQVGAVRPVESGGGEVHAAVPRVMPSNPDTTSEGENNLGAGSFLIAGSVLIGIRLTISYRSRKVRKLAAQTH